MNDSFVRCAIVMIRAILMRGVAFVIYGSLVLVGSAAGQMALFALYSGIAVFVARRWYAARPVESEDPLLNDRTARLIGRSVTAVSAIDAHSGRVRVGDGEWNARGGPAQPGEQVLITGVEGNCLIVEPVRTLPPA